MATAEEIQVLTIASGSSGNSLMVRGRDTRILVDAGVSRRRIQHALADHTERLADLSAILITHEHKDHVSGIPMIHKREHHVPIYATRGTLNACRSDYGWGLGAHTVRAGHSFEVGAVRVTPIAVRHDAAEPVGYRLDWPGFSMAVVTDLGQAEAAVRDAVADCELLVLEFNYDVDMLRWGKYPGWLKGRVSSSRGHLSNFQAQQFLRRVAGPRLREVVLIHLSKENNRPDLADEMAKRALADWPRVKVTVAAREEPGELLRIPTSGTVRRTMPTVRAVPRQGTLF